MRWIRRRTLYQCLLFTVLSLASMGGCLTDVVLLPEVSQLAASPRVPAGARVDVTFRVSFADNWDVELVEDPPAGGSLLDPLSTYEGTHIMGSDFRSATHTIVYNTRHPTFATITVSAGQGAKRDSKSISIVVE